jgi:hypothetical protein
MSKKISLQLIKIFRNDFMRNNFTNFRNDNSNVGNISDRKTSNITVVNSSTNN